MSPQHSVIFLQKIMKSKWPWTSQQQFQKQEDNTACQIQRKKSISYPGFCIQPIINQV